MGLPGSALVFGYGTETKAVCAILRLFLRESFCYPLDALEREIAGRRPAVENVLVVLLSNTRREQETSDAIHQFASLRFQLKWRGPIRLVTDSDEVRKLYELDLFKRQRKSPTVGQVCLTRPLLVDELISVLSLLRHYSEGAWRIWEDRKKGLEVWKLYAQIENEISRSLWP